MHEQIFPTHKCRLTWRRVVCAACAILSLWIVCVSLASQVFSRFSSLRILQKYAKLRTENILNVTEKKQLQTQPLRFAYMNDYHTNVLCILQKYQTLRTYTWHILQSTKFNLQSHCCFYRNAKRDVYEHLYIQGNIYIYLHTQCQFCRNTKK